MTGPSPDGVLAAALNSLVGLTVRSAWLGVGTHVALDCGGERQTSTEHLIMGDYSLWIEMAAWRVWNSKALVATFNDERAVMERAVADLEGRAVTRAESYPDKAELRVTFEGDRLLQVAATGEPLVEHWLLFLPDDHVIVAGPGNALRVVRADQPRT